MTKKDLKKTVEYQYHKKQMIFFSVMSIVIISIIGLSIFFFSKDNPIKYLRFIFGVMLFPFVVYHEYKRKKILKCPETYQSFKVSFMEVTTSITGLLGFEFLIPMTEFKKVRVTTKTIYSSSFLSVNKPRFIDYHNKENQVLYSESLHKVLVVKK